VLYVNNIRSYYNILKWLTANEETEEAEPGIENLPELPEEPAEITET
jgi:membrane-bound lytic murein transglycosylase MltF